MTKDKMLKIAFEKRAKSDFPFATDVDKNKPWYIRATHPALEVGGGAGLLGLSMLMHKKGVGPIGTALVGGAGLGMLGIGTYGYTPHGKKNIEDAARK